MKQASCRRLWPPDRRATVFAVTSGKGGVGKTNIAANLAICLSAASKKVVLIDADLGLANLDVILNINSRYNLSHVISGVRHIEEITQSGPAGIEVVCGASGLEGLADLTHFQRQRLIEELGRLGADSRRHYYRHRRRNEQIGDRLLYGVRPYPDSGDAGADGDDGCVCDDKDAVGS